MGVLASSSASYCPSMIFSAMQRCGKRNMLSLYKKIPCRLVRTFFDFIRNFNDIDAAFIEDEDVIMHDYSSALC